MQAIQDKITEIRKDFPTLCQTVNGRQLVYFDNGASALKPQLVIDTISEFYSDYYSNVHRGVHHLSRKATTAYEKVREKVRDFINAASTEEIINTYGTTDAINLVSRTYGEQYVGRGDEIIITEMDHHANIVPWQLLAEKKGATIVPWMLEEDATLSTIKLKSLLTEKTKIIAVSHVSNVLGTINPIKEICSLAHNYDIPVLVDGAQGIIHSDVDVRELDADFYAFSAHKMLGPTGTGILYAKKEFLAKMPPYRGGGDMIDRVTLEKTTYNDLPFKFEAGTPHISGVIGMGAAIDYLREIGMDYIQEREKKLHTYFLERIKEFGDITLLGNHENSSPVFTFVHNSAHAYDLGTMLDQQGIAVRTGHHCCQPLMNFYGISSTSRASLLFYNTEEEIDIFAEALKKAIEICR